MTPEQVAELRRLAEAWRVKRKAHQDALRTYYAGNSQDQAAVLACSRASVEAQDASEEYSAALREHGCALIDALAAAQRDAEASKMALDALNAGFIALRKERDDWKHESGLNRTTIANLEVERDALRARWGPVAEALCGVADPDLEQPVDYVEEIHQERERLQAECERLKGAAGRAFDASEKVACQWADIALAHAQELEQAKAILAEAVALLRRLEREVPWDEEPAGGRLHLVVTAFLSKHPEQP